MTTDLAIKPPTIEDLPDWAVWLAQDEDGMWVCFSHQPDYYTNGSEGYWESPHETEDSLSVELWKTFPAIDASTTLVKVR